MSLFGIRGRKPRSAGSTQRASQPSAKKEWVRVVVLVAAFVVMTGLVSHRWTSVAPTGYVVRTEGFASETITADFRFRTVDLEATRLAQEAAAAKVPDTYRVDRSLVEARLKDFEDRVAFIKSQREPLQEHIFKALRESNSQQPTQEIVAAAVEKYAADLVGKPPFQDLTDARALALWLTPTLESIPEREFAQAPEGQPAPVVNLKPLPGGRGITLAYVDRLADLARGALEYTLHYGVLNPETPSDASRVGTARDREPRSVQILRDKPMFDHSRTEEFARSDAPVITTARRMLRERIKLGNTAVPPEAPSPEETGDALEMENAAYAIAQLSLGETLVFDAVTTEGAREAARKQVEPVEKWIERDQAIQERGHPWTEQSRLDYQTYMEKKMSGQEPRGVLISVLANAVLVGLVLICLVRSLTLLVPEHQASMTRDLSLTLLLQIGILLLGRVSYYIEPSGCVVPLAVAGILSAILLNTRIAAVTALLLAVLVSIQYNYSWPLFVVGSSMSFAGIFSIYKVRRRSDMTRAALKAMGIGVIAAAAVTLTSGTHVHELSRNMVLVLLNGTACLLMVPALLPSLEHLFGITTDIQLLEYSDLNNELLSRLAIEVPATYAHSLMLGQLAEAASEAIGANGLLARVCAYYHDIGKLKRPEYFAENQTGPNIHDMLSPRLSARAIASHVYEGAEMAREHHLPKPLIDAIFEHHGTCLISFFYQQALAQQKHGDVREEDFRYPGPRPQSRETAILMICDAAESAVRSLKNPNEERIRELVDKLIRARSEDHQFDECALTLKDLNTIGEEITKRLVVAGHRRIPYPETRDVEATEAYIGSPGVRQP
ncbi:MAG TPA: HDIG domain-containing protein [Candidatus Hydrogenedentes bacterium]|nr:HDIG domain-containing protein [Candidatus Hydrogenedentota bacterium]